MAIETEVDSCSIQEYSFNHNRGLYLLLALLFLPILFMPMIYEPDTVSYLMFDSQRPPLMPLFINFDKLITGEHFLLLRFFQTGLMCLAIVYLDKWLRQMFQVSKHVVVMLVFLFFTPIIYHGHFGRMLMSEAISFPLFLMTLILLCQLFVNLGLKEAISFSICVGLLILTRNQFYYLYGFFPLFLLWAWYRKMPRKKITLVTTVFVGCFLLTTLISLCYHKMVHYTFAQTTANGPLLLVQPLYLSKRGDAQYFENTRERAAFLAMYDNAAQKKLLYHSDRVDHPGFVGWDLLPSYVHFVDAFNPIQFQSLNVLLKMGYTKYAADHLMTEIAKTLFQYNLKENLLFYGWKFFYSLGGALVIIAFIILAMVAFFALLRNRNDRTAIITIALLLIVFANNFTVAISEMILNRYLIYSGLALSILMVILLGQKRQVSKGQE